MPPCTTPSSTLLQLHPHPLGALLGDAAGPSGDPASLVAAVLLPPPAVAPAPDFFVVPVTTRPARLPQITASVGLPAVLEDRGKPL